MVRHIASFSGGKDSTAMVLRLIAERWPLDEIVWFDTGWEFPQMLTHIDDLERYIGRPITRLRPERPYTYWMLERPVVARTGLNKGTVHRIGNGWPSARRRWCTCKKIDTLGRHARDAVCYIGIAADEQHRCDRKALREYGRIPRFPLVEWGMTEADCLAYCYERGFRWGGLYEHFSRVSCFCCPLQSLADLRALRHEYPALWAQMMAWDEQMGETNRGFHHRKTVRDLDRRFACEDRQRGLFDQEG